MVELIAKTPCAGLLPVTVGTVTLEEVAAGPITSVMPYDGQADATSAALNTACGIEFPAPGRSTGGAGARAIWTGAGQAMVLGVPVGSGLAQSAALSDQSDAWAVMRVEGADVEDVLARLTPLDLDAGVFKEGHAARSLLGHMNAIFLRESVEAVLILVFRSMARTAVHEIETAMRSVAARAAME